MAVESEFEQEFKKSFTPDQIRWLRKNNVQLQGRDTKEKIAYAAHTLFNAGEFMGAEGRNKLVDMIQAPSKVMDLQSLAEAAGFKDEKEGKTAASQFLDAYFNPEQHRKDSDLWAAGIAKEFGEGHWKDAQKVLQQAENDRMLARIEKKRQDVLNGDAEEFPWYQNLAFKAVSPLQSLFTPRRKKAIQEGRDPNWSETLADIGESTLYALPAGKIGQGATFLTKNTPKLARAASKVLGTLAADAAAPFAVVGMDQALGNEDYSWDEALTEGGIGTATNLGVGRGMARVLGPMYQMGMGKIRGKLPTGVVDFLEGRNPVKDRAKEKVAEANSKLMDHYMETAGRMLHRIARGETPSMLNQHELSRIKDIVELGDYYRDKSQNLTDVLERAIKERTGRPAMEAIKGIGTEPLYQLDLPDNRKTYAELVDDVVESANLSPFPQKEQVARALKSDPELLSLFYKPTKAEKFDDIAADAIKTWGINKYGSDHDAGMVLNTVGGSVKELRKEQAESKEKRKNDKAASKLLTEIVKADNLGNVIDYKEGLTPEDTMWLTKISKDPGMLTGLREGSDPKFRNWMLMRGTDLLKGTSLARPTWDVEVE